MAPDDNNGARPAGPVVLRIKLRYDDVEAMVQRFAPNVGKSGLFLPTRSIQPVGTELKFELRLANDVPVLVGMGRVKHVKSPDPDNPRAAFGMAIELMRVSREGREVIIRMLERRRAMGLPDVALPIPEDIETARRAEVETQPRRDEGSVVRDAMANVTSASASLLTSARPGSGPIAIARDENSGRVPVPVLTPERSRPRRPQVQELIDRAAELSSRIVLPTPELDMHVDVKYVLSRARALAGGDLDVELAALREAAATPVEINVEAASAELARQLGGKPIAKRERSARWQAPPPVEMKSVLPAPGEPVFVPQMRADSAPSAAVETELKTPVDSSPSLVPEESYDDAFVANASTTTAVEPELPKPHAASLEVRTDVANQQALMIDDDADVSSFERALDAARIHTGVSKVAPERPDDGELDDDSPAADLLVNRGYQLDEPAGDRTQIGATPVDPEAGQFPTMSEQLAVQLDQQLADAEAEAAREFAAGIGVRFADEDEEISDLDVLAEADEDDEDLMSAHGEAEVSKGHAAAAEAYDPYVTPPPVEPPVAQPSVTPPPDDFASRLDLGDDDDGPPPPSDEIDRNDAREFERELDVHAPYQRARRASSEHSYTFAEDNVPQSIPHFAPHETGEEFDEPHRYAPQSAPQPARGPDPRLLQHGRPTTSADSLENALATLDVADIDLEQQRRTRRPTPGASRALPGLPMESSGPRPLPGVASDPSVPRALPGESSGSRPLPGLPVERPRTGPVPVQVQQQPSSPQRVAHTVPRSGARTTGQQGIQRPHQQTGPQPQILGNPPSGPQPVPKPGQSRTAKPPPIPAAARKGSTQQVPLVKPPTQQAPVVQPTKRAPTDDGVLIDFDDDE